MRATTSVGITLETKEEETAIQQKEGSLGPEGRSHQQLHPTTMQNAGLTTATTTEEAAIRAVVATRIAETIPHQTITSITQATAPLTGRIAASIQAMGRTVLATIRTAVNVPAMGRTVASVLVSDKTAASVPATARTVLITARIVPVSGMTAREVTPKVVLHMESRGISTTVPRLQVSARVPVVRLRRSLYARTHQASRLQMKQA